MGNKAYILRHLHAMAPGAVIALVLFAAALPLRRMRLDRLKLKSPAWREAVLALFWAYCGAMLMVLLFPSDFDLLNVLRHGYEGPFFRLGNTNLQVLKTLGYSKLTFAANVFLFFPLGFCPALLWRDGRWWKALLAALAVPAAVENWQLFIGRTFDVDDLILNALGILLGWLLWRFFGDPKLHCVRNDR